MSNAGNLVNRIGLQRRYRNIAISVAVVAIGVAVLHKTPPIPPPFEVIFYDLGVESNSVS